MNTYTGMHAPVTAALLTQLVAEHCHSRDIIKIEEGEDFFGCKTWNIHSPGESIGALQQPDGLLTITEDTSWPILPGCAPHAVVHFVDQGEDGLFFYLKPKAAPDSEGCPDWHLGGSWPEFDALFDEASENDFASGENPEGATITSLTEQLRGLGFDTFVEDQEDENDYSVYLPDATHSPNGRFNPIGFFAVGSNEVDGLYLCTSNRPDSMDDSPPPSVDARLEEILSPIFPGSSIGASESSHLIEIGDYTFDEARTLLIDTMLAAGWRGGRFPDEGEFSYPSQGDEYESVGWRNF